MTLPAGPAPLIETFGAGVLGRGELALGIGRSVLVHERLAGAGEDDHAELAVAGDVGTRVTEAVVRFPVPGELAAVGVQLEQQDVVVGLLEPEPRVPVVVVVEVGALRHGSSRPRGRRHR